ncbi:hypothetical protein [Actinoplanes sp. M2I2]|nr:hypothetical protein [Actinoplanes sp. M2I2]
MASHVAQFLVGDEQWSPTPPAPRRSIVVGGRPVIAWRSRQVVVRGTG